MRYGDVRVLDPALQDSGTRPNRFRVLRLEEDGTGTFVSFLFVDDVELPALNPWDARVTVAPGPGGHVVSFAPAPPPPEVPVTGEVVSSLNEAGDLVPVPPTTPVAVLSLTSGGASLFRWWGAVSPWTASPEVLEDFASPMLQLRAFSVGEWSFVPLDDYGLHRDFIERTQWDSPFDGSLFKGDDSLFGESPLQDVGPVRYVRLGVSSSLAAANAGATGITGAGLVEWGSPHSWLLFLEFQQ